MMTYVFFAMSARAFPQRWIVHHMPMKRGSLWVIFSTLTHEGGGLPLRAESPSRRIIAFCGLSTHTASHATTHHITPPFRAFKTKGIRASRWMPPEPHCREVFR